MYAYLIRNSTVQELVSSKKDISQEIDGEDSPVAEMIEQIKELIIEDEMLDKEIQKMRELKQEDISK